MLIWPSISTSFYVCLFVCLSVCVCSTNIKFMHRWIPYAISKLNYTVTIQRIPIFNRALKKLSTFFSSHLYLYMCYFQSASHISPWNSSEQNCVSLLFYRSSFYTTCTVIIIAVPFVVYNTDLSWLTKYFMCRKH